MTLAVIVYKLLLIQCAQESQDLANEIDIFESKHQSVSGGLGLQQEEENLLLRPKSAQLPSMVELQDEEVAVITSITGKRRLRSQKFEDYDDSILSSVFVYKP